MVQKAIAASRHKLQNLERRQAILLAASDAFCAFGYEATSLLDISAAAHVSKVLIYRHFGSKKEIYEAILENFSRRINNMADMPKQEGLETRLDALVELAAEYPSDFMLLFHHVPREPEFAHYAAALQNKRSVAIAHRLAPIVANKNERTFYAHMLDKIVIGALIAWVEAGTLYPDKMRLILDHTLHGFITSVTRK